MYHISGIFRAGTGSRRLQVEGRSQSAVGKLRGRSPEAVADMLGRRELRVTP